MSSDHETASLATAADLRALPEEVVAEVIEGHLVHKASPTFQHGTTQSHIDRAIGWHFGGPPGGGLPGGWWLCTEVEVHYEAHEVYRHDLVGWRRDRHPDPPCGFPVKARPDWACEVLSPSNWANDTVRKFRTLQRAEVPHYWVVDVEHGTVTVHEWRDGVFATVAIGARGEMARLPPFDSIELDVDHLLGGDATRPTAG